MAKKVETALQPFDGSAIGGMEMARIPTADLRAELARGLTLTAQHLAHLGMVWAELERRGEDLTDLREGLAEWLPLIAAGRLAAEAVVAFATKRLLLRALEGVPLDRQRRIAAGEEVEVIDPASAAGVSTMPAARLPAAAVRLVFADGEVRTPQAQRLALRPRAPKRQEPAGHRYRPRYDRATGAVHIGKMSVKVSDLLAELASASGPELPLIARPEEYLHVKVRLTPEEYARLQEAAGQAGLPDWEMARKALRGFGLI